MFDLAAVQKALQELGLDGWLLYDFAASTYWPGTCLTCRPIACCRAAKVFSCPQRASRQLCPSHRIRFTRRLPQQQRRSIALAGTGSRRRLARAGAPQRGDGVSAAQRQSLCIRACRCGHRQLVRSSASRSFRPATWFGYSRPCWDDERNAYILRPPKHAARLMTPLGLIAHARWWFRPRDGGSTLHSRSLRQTQSLL